MAEVAGLVLGAIPITIWALEKYQEPFEVYTDYNNIINTLKVNLQIQKLHLDTTLASIGLQDPTPQELQECIKRKLPDRHYEVLYIIKQMDKLTADLMDNLKIDINKKPCWTDEPPERVSWEWRRVKRSFGSKKRDKILQDLRNWNDDLKNLVEKAEVPAEDGSAAVEKVKLRFNRQNCDSVRERIQSLHRAVKAGIECDEPSHQASIKLDWKDANGNAAQRFTVCILHGSKPTSSTPWRSFHAANEVRNASSNGSATSLLQLPSPSPTTRSPSPSSRFGISRMLGRTRKTVTVVTSDVTVEEISLSESMASTLTLNSPSIKNLCAEVADAPCPDKCVGSLQDPESVGRDGQFSLSHISKDQPRIIEAISFKSVLGDEPDHNCLVSDLSLSAKQRYAMAASLAKTVLYLSGSPWLGEQWDREQLKLFLQQNAAGLSSLSDNPYISYIFADQSTSMASEAPDESISQMMRLIPNAFIFALGIILVELAVNEVFQKTSLEAVLEGDFLTLRRKLDKVYREAGSLYGNAAQRCVNCEFMGHSSNIDFGQPMFRRQFYDTVVAPLQATYEVFSTLYAPA